MNKKSTKNNEYPKNNQYVLGYLNKTNWHDDPNGMHYWVVVKFKRGISQKERELLPDSDERKRVIKGSDEHGNNLVPYSWDTFGTSEYFGQEIDTWYELEGLEK